MRYFIRFQIHPILFFVDRRRQQVEDLSKLFKESRAVFVEGDSTDYTRDMLRYTVIVPESYGI